MKRILSFALLSLLILSTACWASEDTKSVIEKIKAELTDLLAEIDFKMASAAVELSGKEPAGEEARAVLRNLCRENKYAVDCGILNAAGIMVAIEPEEYRKFEGSDVSKQDSVIRLRETKNPVFSNVFPVVEGFDAVVLGYPVFSAEGELLGSLSMLVEPRALLSDIILPAIQGTGIEVWVMEKGGLVIYDRDKEEIGRNVFTDSLYKPFTDFIDFARKVAENEEGTGSYEFLAEGLKMPVLKNAAWNTVSINGIDWRIVGYTVVSQ